MAEATASRTVSRRTVSSVPAWLPITSLTIALLGLGVSIYMTYEHFTDNHTLACSSTGVVDCLAVTTSKQSMVFGVIPVAVLGLVFFVGIIPLLLPAAWRINTDLVRRGRIAAVGVGVLFVFYLIFVELFDVGKICEFCTAVHILTFLLFGVIVFGTAALEPVSSRADRY
jgi:uncharacterized membrane protein